MENKEKVDSTTVPVLEHLDYIYHNTQNRIKSETQPRYQNLIKRFKDLYECKPQFFCRAPGKVNIIGEHIDYSGYSVLPAAIEQVFQLIQDCVFAYCVTDDDTIQINNLDQIKFQGATIQTDVYQKFDEPSTWLNYIRCGYKAILTNQKVEVPKGIKILVDSNIPIGAGLSSSNALTVCMAVCTIHANGLIDDVPKQQLAEQCAQSQKLCGMKCSRIDEILSILAEKSTGKHIEFNPKLIATDIQIPEDACFVIANSCTPSAQMMAQFTRQNKRIVELRFAGAIIAKGEGLISKCEQYKDQFEIFYHLQNQLGVDSQQMVELIKKYLKKGNFTQDQLKKELNVRELVDIISDISFAYEILSNNFQFNLYDRAMHVFQETERVLKFKNLCDRGENSENLLKELGQIMKESQASNKELYECSSPELDELIDLCNQSGAYGTKLTGAGWGGCCIALINKSNVQSFLDLVETYFTKEREPGSNLWITDDLQRYIFATEPGRGACVLDPQYTIWF